MSGRNPRKIDVNQNHMSDWQSQHGYTLVTRRLLVPNNLLATLDDAAHNSGFSPIPQRQPKAPVRLDEVAYDTAVRPVAQRQPKVPIRVGPTKPIVNQAVGYQVSMAERRQLRFQNSKHPSVNENSKPKPQDVQGDGKNIESTTKSQLEMKALTEQIAQMKVNENNKPKPRGVHGDGKHIESTNRSKLEMKKLTQEAAQTKKVADPKKKPLGASALDDQHKVSTPCCCLRPRGVVHCRLCGFRIKGNIRMVCPEHEQRYSLNEMEVCLNPLCKAPGYLIEESDE